MTDLSHRERHQVPNHLRPIAVQQLDALLRIEELLSRLLHRVDGEIAVKIAAEDAAKEATADPVEEEKPVGRRRRS